MADDSQKSPLIKNLQYYVQAMIDHALETLGKSLPCTVSSVDDTGTVVTVDIDVQDPVQQFPQLTVPVLYPRYVRFPIQPGDPGMLVPCDVYLGGVSGLGGGTATMAPQGNLSAVGFLALGGGELRPADDPEATEINGPNGVILRDDGENGPGPNGSTVRIAIDKEGNVIIYGAKSFSYDVGGCGMRITQTGPGAWVIDDYTQGVTVNNHPPHPPVLPDPPS